MQGFTNEQERPYNKYKKIQDYFNTNSAQVTGYLPLKNEKTDFDTNLTKVVSLVPRKVVDNSGITVHKEADKRDVADYWSPLCKKTLAYAKKYNKEELIADFKHRNHTSFIKLLDGDVLPNCKHVNDAITLLLPDVQFIPYGIVAGDLSSGLLLANDFNGMIGKTGAADSDKTVASGDIVKVMQLLQGNNEQFTLLVNAHFITSDPDFVAGYNAANVEDDIGVHHNGIEGFVKNKADGTPIIGATIKNIQTGKSVASDLTGFYSFLKFIPNNYQFEVSAAGKKTLTVVIRIRRGHILHIDFELENL